MCDQNTLQQKIADLTNNGEVVIRFLADTVQGKTPHVQPCHRLEATRQLIRLGTLDTTAGASGRTPTSPDAPKTQDTNPVTADPDQKNTYDYTESDPDPDQDCYYEPLSPEDQALFDYHTLIESGEYEEGEIQPRAVTETDRLGYQAMLNGYTKAPHPRASQSSPTPSPAA